MAGARGTRSLSSLEPLVTIPMLALLWRLDRRHRASADVAMPDADLAASSSDMAASDRTDG